MKGAAPYGPVRLYVYFKLSLEQAQAWRERWRSAAQQAAATVPGVQLSLSERPEAHMTWMESYRAATPAQMADAEALMARSLMELGVERHREVFVETYRVG
ncbi:hypothetical protein HNQ51_002762 [Inhella inkyongensis]|uniref:DUF4936 family protein n=1 Tax=Inhella inkyongensis TaxID=392593 RepID=A0A840S6X5_9BURK|nr:DUF4936 family protein [Inhella inkyongensis]MBB5205443.1 hypothetical protein [Inhella inkyongensis]